MIRVWNSPLRQNVFCICDIDTGEIIKPLDYRWYDEGKRKTKKWIKDNGYEFVKAEDDEYGAFIVWVRKIK